MANGGWARWVCGRRSKFVVVALWFVMIFPAFMLAGKLTGVQQNDNSAWLPGSAEATQVAELQRQFQPDDIIPAVIVYERANGLTQADKDKAAADARAMAGVDGVSGQIPPPLVSQDGQAIQVLVPIKVDADGWDQIVDVVDAVKAVTGEGANGLDVHLAGAAGDAADSASAFEGIDRRLL